MSLDQISSWEAYSSSAIQVTPSILWNPKAHCHVHKRQKPILILSQINPVHTLITHFLKIHLSIIFLSTLGIPSGLLPSGLPTNSLCVDCVWNVMAHAQKPDFVFRRNVRVNLNRRGASVQSTTGSRGVHISGSNAGYTMFRGSVKSTGYSLDSSVPPSLPSVASPCAITFQPASTSPISLTCHLPCLTHYS